MTNAVELTIKTREMEVNLNLKSASKYDRVHLFNIIGEALGVKQEVPFITDLNIGEPKLYELGNSEPKPLFETKTVPNISSSINSLKGELILKDPSEVIKAKVGTSKQLQMINSDRSSMVSLGEKLQGAIESTEEPDFWKTGIKIDEDGTKLYRTYYVCECGHKGRRYIELGGAPVCHNCDQPVNPVRRATDLVDEEGIPVERDQWGNFFVAKFFYSA